VAIDIAAEFNTFLTYFMQPPCGKSRIDLPGYTLTLLWQALGH